MVLVLGWFREIRGKNKEKTIVSERTIETNLIEAKSLANSEYGHIQIQMHALSEAEKQRSAALKKCIEHIQSALDVLAEQEK